MQVISSLTNSNPEEVALNFKNHGNELYAQKSYRDAIKAYTSAIEVNPKSIPLRITLHNNRAACNLPLKNHGEVLKDTKAVISLVTPNEVPPKTWYRAAQSLVALERWMEARDCVERGLESELIGNETQSDERERKRKVWDDLTRSIDGGQRKVEERIERERRERVGKEALRRAVAVGSFLCFGFSLPWVAACTELIKIQPICESSLEVS